MVTPSTATPSSLVRAAAKAAVTEAVAAARCTCPSAVEQIDASNTKPKGAFRTGTVWMTETCTAAGKFTKQFETAVEAACASDLIRLALRSSEAAPRNMNFPPGMYRQQQVAAWGALLQQWQPGLRVAAWDAGAAAEVAARAAAERAAMSAAADAAAAVRLASPAAAQQVESNLIRVRYVQYKASRAVDPWQLGF